MSERDFAVGTVGIPSVGHVSKKPCYLVTLTDSTSKSKSLVNFIAIIQPDLQLGFIAVKGFFCDKSEDDIVAQFTDIVASTPKDQILDLQLPTHRVHCIRSLVFNANKPSTLTK